MSTPYELLARFNNDGTIAGCHVKTITTVDGKDYESDPVPLKDATDKAFTQFVEAFSAGLVSERDSLAKDKAQLVTDADATTKQIERLQQSVEQTATQLAHVTAEKEAVIADLNKLQEEKAKMSSDAISLRETNAKQISDLTESNAKQLVSIADELEKTKALLVSAQQTIADQTDRAAKLVAALPFNPRLIKVDAFLVRVKNEMFALVKDSMVDVGTGKILELLLAKDDAKAPVNLDSPNLTGALQYLIERGRLTENRAKEIMQDATRDEAYMEPIS